MKAKQDTSRKADNKLSVKRKDASDKASKREAKKKRAAAKDPNKPKRPPSAFFVFMEDFRKQFKEKNPDNKSVAAVGKAGGERWKSLSESEKAPFIAKAEKRKVEYNKTMVAYNKKLAGGESSSAADEEEEESEKSKSEVHNGEDNEDTGEEEDDNDDE